MKITFLSVRVMQVVQTGKKKISFISFSKIPKISDALCKQAENYTNHFLELQFQ